MRSPNTYLGQPHSRGNCMPLFFILSLLILIILLGRISTAIAQNTPDTPDNCFIGQPRHEVDASKTSSNIAVFNVSNIMTSDIASVSFRVRKKTENHFAKEVIATYSLDSLQHNEVSFEIPVYSLYANYTNNVEITYHSKGGDVCTTTDLKIETEPSGTIYDNLSVTVPVTDITGIPSFSYFLIKSAVSGPVIVDIDGEVRWISKYPYSAFSSNFDGFKIVAYRHNKLCLHYLDDTTQEVSILTEGNPYGISGLESHHDLRFMPNGNYLLEVNAVKGNAFKKESILLEVSDEGAIIEQWDFNEIIANHIRRSGEDPSSFVRDCVDWFHMNSAIYDPSDHSIIASSRENFVIKVDYESKNITWLFGDESKYWYRAFSALQGLSLQSQNKPVGQHSLSLIQKDGASELLLFNNRSPAKPGRVCPPYGDGVDTSKVERYRIDKESKIAPMTWDYDAGLISSFCSSVYCLNSSSNTPNASCLITYSNNLNDDEEPVVIHRIIDEAGNLQFEAETNLDNNNNNNNNNGCIYSWNSLPIDISNITFSAKNSTRTQCFLNATENGQRCLSRGVSSLLDMPGGANCKSFSDVSTHIISDMSTETSQTILAGGPKATNGAYKNSDHILTFLISYFLLYH